MNGFNFNSVVEAGTLPEKLKAFTTIMKYSSPGKQDLFFELVFAKLTGNIPVKVFDPISIT